MTSGEGEKGENACGCGTACASVTPSVAVSGPGSAGVTTFRIPTMDCPTEEGEIRHALATVAGIRRLNFQLSARTLGIDASAEALPQALAVIRKAGFDPQPVSQPESSASVAVADENAGFRRPIAALLLAIAAEAVSYFAPSTLVFELLGMVLAGGAIALAGVSTYRKGIAAVRQGRLNMNALMAVAVTGAFLIGQWPEAAMVMALYAIAELIEARAVDRARNAIKKLLDLAPDTAELRQPDGSWQSVAASGIPVDAVVRVKPGARIPLDGVVTAGSSAVNQAPVTGESMPVDKVAGDNLFAGTINETGMLEFRVTAASGNTTLARIIHAVEQAESERAPTQQFVDRFAAIYTPAVFAMALAVALFGPLLTDWSWWQAIYKALVLLVIGCPCALVIATPVTVVSGLAAAAQRGILIKGGVYLENAHRLKAVALDKTGTITAGKPALVDIDVMTQSTDRDHVLRRAAELASHSDHPVSRAIADGIPQRNGGLTDFAALAGRGIQARIDGQTMVLGNHRLIEDRRQCSADIEARLARQEIQGRTVTILASEREVLAIFAVADTIKDSSRTALSSLHAMGVTSVMLTGDNVTTAKAIAGQAGIDDARGNLLPEDKLAAIENLRARYGFTAMTGDGINDAPALARADIGIAMGGAGTDIAMEAADVVIMNDDLRRIPELIRISRKTRAVLWQNIGLALGIKAVFLVLAIFGGATMWMAVFADMGASLIVVFNGLRLMKLNVPRPRRGDAACSKCPP